MSENIVKIRWEKYAPNLRHEADAWLYSKYDHDGWSIRNINVDTKGPGARGEGYYVATYHFDDQNVALEFKMRFG